MGFVVGVPDAVPATPVGGVERRASFPEDVPAASSCPVLAATAVPVAVPGEISPDEACG